MASIPDLIATSGLEVKQIIVGLVTETAGVVTSIPGYDFKVKIHIVSKDENVLSKHEVIVPANGQTLAEFRFDFIGRYVLTVQDEQGRAIPPIKGRCLWHEKRNVFISSASEFEIKCRGRNEVKSDVYVMFNDAQKKRVTLPMPPMGWRIAILTFITKNGDYNIVVDGVKEQPLVRSATAQPRLGLRHSRSDHNRAKTARDARHYHNWTQ